MAEVETIEARRYRDEVEPCSPVSTSSTFSLSSVDSLWADEMDKHDAKTGKAYNDDDEEDEKFKLLDDKEWIQDGIDSTFQESSFEPAYEAEPWYPNQMSYMDDFSLAINPFAMPYYYYPETYQQVYPDEYYYHDGQQYTDEDLLAASLAELLSDPNVNPYNGSVALERLQNLIRYRLPELYAKVIGSRGAAWRAFVERRSEFSMIQVESRPRVRLSSNHEWAAGDRQEQIVRRQSEHHLLICLQNYLESVHDRSCQVDEFMQVYPSLPQNQTPNGPPFPLPERGDFVRFVRRHPSKFTYVKEGYRIFTAGAETE